MTWPSVEKEAVMAHKKKHINPVPPGNQSHVGPVDASGDAAQTAAEATGGGAPFQQEDPKRRLGDFTDTGGHSIQQPGGKNDSNH